jgi:UDPglucose 6-dehydrogenase
MKIGVIGNGFVGHAMSVLSPAVEVLFWDLDPTKRCPYSLTIDQLVKESEIVFVSVPTPMEHSGKCHTDIVENVVHKVQSIDSNKHIVLRSTVPPGTSDRLGVSFLPEFLTEKNWRDDFINCEQWIVGTDDDKLAEKIKDMMNTAYKCKLINTNNVVCVSTKEAEMIKYVKNCFLATKVSFFNEMHSLCEKTSIDYETVRVLAANDSRIGEGHTMVPGHDGKAGFGGTCFPKDMWSLLCHMQENDVTCPVLSGAVTRNETIDRKEKDWNADKGRASI